MKVVKTCPECKGKGEKNWYDLEKSKWVTEKCLLCKGKRFVVVDSDDLQKV